MDLNDVRHRAESGQAIPAADVLDLLEIIDGIPAAMATVRAEGRAEQEAWH